VADDEIDFITEIDFKAFMALSSNRLSRTSTMKSESSIDFITSQSLAFYP